MASVELRNLSKAFDDHDAVAHLDLEIADGEFFSIVGPSGCGKTTVLRMIAGLETPNDGSIILGGHDVTALPSAQRGLGLVTDQNLLIGHRSARGNIAFPLQMRKQMTPADQDAVIEQRTRDLSIGHLLARKPKHLSEGERRAVQLARALVSRPTALLLDEPLAYIDSKLRQKLRADICRLQRDLGVTTLLITADQTDAMAVSDRLAMLVDGTLEQVGVPQDLYERPATTRVAAFLGEPAMNLVDATVEVDGPERWLRLLGHRIRAWSPALDLYQTKNVTVGIRPVDLARSDTANSPMVQGRIVALEATGVSNHLTVLTDRGPTICVATSGPPPRLDSRIEVALAPHRFHLFDPATGLAFHHPSS